MSVSSRRRWTLSVPRPRPPVSDDRSVSPPSGMLWPVRVRRRSRSNFLHLTLSDGAEAVELGKKNTGQQTKVVNLRPWAFLEVEVDGLRDCGVKTNNGKSGTGFWSRLKMCVLVPLIMAKKKKTTDIMVWRFCVIFQTVSTHQRTRIFFSLLRFHSMERRSCYVP